MKKIIFEPSSEEVKLVVPPPKPAKGYVAEWYKSIPQSKKSLDVDSDGKLIKENSLKQCQPFLDSMISGYIQETWCDIYIDFSENSFKYSTASEPQVFSHREKISLNIPGTFPIEFVWTVPWVPKTPNGYSLLFTHPLNRNDLPFITTSGMVDSDKFNHIPNGQLPFYVRNDFSGVIPAGTPMFQILPIKRENWHSKLINFSETSWIKKKYVIEKKFFGQYKKVFWIKKNYN